MYDFSNKSCLRFLSIFIMFFCNVEIQKYTYVIIILKYFKKNSRTVIVIISIFSRSRGKWGRFERRDVLNTLNYALI